jgi:hypothetical protein
MPLPSLVPPSLNATAPLLVSALEAWEAGLPATSTTEVVELRNAIATLKSHLINIR